MASLLSSKVTETIHKKGKSPITFHRGGLHRNTHTPMGQKIPASKVRKALSGGFGPEAKKEAQFDKNVLTGGR